MENSQNTGLIKSTMTYGAILGFVVVAYSFILFIAKVMPVGLLFPSLLFLLSIGVYFAGLYIFTKRIRENLLGGYLTYSQGLMIGMLISLFAAFITSFYTYIQNAFLDPDYVNRFAEAQKNWLINYMSGKVPDEKIEQIIADMNAKMSEYSPLKSMFQGIVGSTLIGTIIALITSAILKRKPNPFQQNLDSNI